jgi:signal transduction histidine kinase
MQLNDRTDKSGENGDLPLILIVDDEVLARQLLRTYLASRGYRTVEAENGEQVLTLLDSGTMPDLILLDIMMPIMSGLQALEQLRRKYQPAELPIILLTALGDTAHVVSGLELGANDYISKPFKLPELGARIRAHINTKLMLEASRTDITRLQALDELKDKFLQITAHDLKSPLATISMGLQILGDNIPKVQPVMPEITRIVHMMGFGARSMRAMIEDYLDLQVLKSGHLPLRLEPLNLNDPLRAAVENLRPYAESKGITLTADLDPNLPLCAADIDRITQVINNLVDNAIKFSPAGKQVIARTRGMPMVGPAPSVNGAESSANGIPAVRLEVKDHGPGISPEEMALLFQEFTRLRNRPTGGEKSSGVGLAITKYLIEAHGGRVGVDSAPGEGSVFWVEIPAVG